jgi:hypothetical protein|tara:strand:+ start:222 stop:359 length:138 start_codon:yes stop_codon:yes gene_type:complete
VEAAVRLLLVVQVALAVEVVETTRGRVRLAVRVRQVKAMTVVRVK